MFTLHIDHMAGSATVGTFDNLAAAIAKASESQYRQCRRVIAFGDCTECGGEGYVEGLPCDACGERLSECE